MAKGTTALAAYKAGGRAAKNPKKKRKNPGFSLPLAAIAGFAPLASHAIRDVREGGPELLAKGLSWRLTGYNVDQGKFDWSGLWQGIMPIFAGLFVHKVAGKLGVNRALAAANVPWLRV